MQRHTAFKLKSTGEYFVFSDTSETGWATSGRPDLFGGDTTMESYKELVAKGLCSLPDSEDKIELVELVLMTKKELENYEHVMRMAEIPELIIKHPEFVRTLPMTQDDIEWANKKIEEHNNPQK